MYVHTHAWMSSHSHPNYLHCTHIHVHMEWKIAVWIISFLFLFPTPLGCDALHTGLLSGQTPWGYTLPSGSTAHHLQAHPRGLWYIMIMNWEVMNSPLIDLCDYRLWRREVWDSSEVCEHLQREAKGSAIKIVYKPDSSFNHSGVHS